MQDPPDPDDVDGVDGQAPDQAGPTVASVPFMITRAQRAALRLAGASEDDIRSMKPEDAERFLDRRG